MNGRDMRANTHRELFLNDFNFPLICVFDEQKRKKRDSQNDMISGSLQQERSEREDKKTRATSVI